MENIAEKYITTILQIMQEVTNNYEYNKDIVRKSEGELQDLEHEIELSKPKNARDGYELYRELRRIRIQRRVAKEENEIMEGLYDYFKSNPSIKNKLQELQGKSAKLCEAIENRKYRPRQRDDLTITEEKSTVYKPFEEQLKNFRKIKVTKKNGKMRK